MARDVSGWRVERWQGCMAEDTRVMGGVRVGVEGWGVTGV